MQVSGVTCEAEQVESASGAVASASSKTSGVAPEDKTEPVSTSALAAVPEQVPGEVQKRETKVGDGEVAAASVIGVRKADEYAMGALQVGWW